MQKVQYISKRTVTFKNTNTPLTSPRVSIILGSPKDSAKLADAVRALRNNTKATFKISEITTQKIKRATISSK